jgi:formylglycine-generating enzyme required for sulfatase activity
MKSLLCAALLLALPGLAAGQEEEEGRQRESPRPLLKDSGMVRIEEFYIDVYEYPNQQGLRPKVNVTWREAEALCAARGKRLCTEQEWQKAATGPQNHPYGYGPEFEPGRCNVPYLENGLWKRGPGLAPSGAFARCASQYGVHDMIGNVWEWTSTWYSQADQWRVVRGGSFFHSVNLARADTRYGHFLGPDYRLDLVGFRCCRSAP